jgi:alkylated DNA repair dioxygenase AlkB
MELKEDCLIYRPNFIKDPKEMYGLLKNQVKWRQDNITLFGKTHAIPRYHAWYGEPGASYKYSRITMPINEWLPVIKKIKTEVEKLIKLKFNSVLLNYYRDGHDSNGWHSDNEPELLKPIHVASVSLGAIRDMQFRTVGLTKVERVLSLESGSLLVMKSPLQENWQHQIPKRKKVKEGRINLTFRMVSISS